METLNIAFRAETEEGEDAQISFAQKDCDFIYMTVGGKTYKFGMNGLLLNIWTLEMRRRQIKEDEGLE
jgi:hypothetical protein